MNHRLRFLLAPLALGAAIALGACDQARARNEGVRLPDPQRDLVPVHPGEQMAVFAGGCFWGVESVFDHVKGVREASAGYAGGAAATAHYGEVSSGDTGHAESVQVRYDPTKVSYGQLLKIFFSVAHDPTTRNRQGPDRGSQYRSVIFYASAQQRQVAQAYIAQLQRAHLFNAPIVTEVAPLEGFYPAEGYHQDYASRHPNDTYIVYNDAPKLVHFRQLLPTLYRPEQQVVQVQLP